MGVKNMTRQLTLQDIIGEEQKEIDYRKIWDLFYEYLMTHDNETYSAEELRQITREIEYKEWGII